MAIFYKKDKGFIDEKGVNADAIFAQLHPSNVVTPAAQPVIQQPTVPIAKPGDYFSPEERATLQAWNTSGNKTLQLNAQKFYMDRINQENQNQKLLQDQKLQQAQQAAARKQQMDNYNLQRQRAMDEMNLNKSYNDYTSNFKPQHTGGFLMFGGQDTQPLTKDEFMPKLPDLPTLDNYENMTDEELLNAYYGN